jgi:hypothetical protein
VNLHIRPNFCVQFTHEGLTLSCGVGPGHYCDNNSVLITDLWTQASDFDSGERLLPPKTPGLTATMECALFRERTTSFINLPQSYVPYVPLSKLGTLLQILGSTHPIEDRIEMLVHAFKETS